MQPPISPRRKIRRLALQALYAWSFCPDNLEAVLSALSEHSEYQGYLNDPYFQFLIRGVTQKSTTLDNQIIPHATRSLNQLGPVELAILRIASFELAEAKEVPPKVVINEAIELAKAFGATDSFKFVNGVLHQLMRHAENAEEAKLD